MVVSAARLTQLAKVINVYVSRVFMTVMVMFTMDAKQVGLARSAHQNKVDRVAQLMFVMVNKHAAKTDTGGAAIR
jgi:hypothetical protein